jgi:hypothetical protein
MNAAASQPAQQHDHDLPPIVMGRMYIGKMEVFYDISGILVLKYSDGAKVMFLADKNDPSVFIMAEAMGYGRQVDLFTRDRTVLHCMIAERAETEPFYLRDQAPNQAINTRIDAMMRYYSGMDEHQRFNALDRSILSLFEQIMTGGGISA